MHQKKVLIGDPKNSGNKHAPASRLGQRRQDGGNSEKDVPETRKGHAHNQNVNGARSNSPRQPRRLQRDFETRAPLSRFFLGGFDQNAPQCRRRRNYFRSFQNSWAIQYRLGQFIQRSCGAGGTGKFYVLAVCFSATKLGGEGFLCGVLSFWLGGAGLLLT